MHQVMTPEQALAAHPPPKLQDKSVTVTGSAASRLWHYDEVMRQRTASAEDRARLVVLCCTQ